MVVLSWINILLWLAVLATAARAYRATPASRTDRLPLLLVVTATVANVAVGLGVGGIIQDSATAVLLAFSGGTACLGFYLATQWRLQTRSQDARREAEEGAAATLRQELQEWRRMFETSPDLILVTDRRGNILRVSPSSIPTIGYAPEDIVGRSAKDFIFLGDLDSTRHEMRLARSGRSMRNFQTRYVHRDGAVVPLAWSGVWSESEQRHYFIGRDMTEAKRVEERLSHMAHFDQLTGLANRVSLHQDLADMVEAIPTSPVSIAVVDLDGFKEINDTLGHTRGDKLLQEVARRMRAASNGCRFYRLGGDEFVMVIPNCGDPLVATEKVSLFLGELEEQIDVDEHGLFIAASAGIAVAPTDGISADELLASADLALYEAKSAGGRSYRLFAPHLKAKANARRELDAEIRRAYANEEFALHFQPQFRASDGTITGAEALLRWNHPTKGVLPPGIFIDALAASPLASEMGRWILRSACTTASSWRHKGLPGLRVAVNLFPAQFANGTLLTDVEDALRSSGLPPEALELEITENIALEHEDPILLPLRTLRKSGIGIAFDDFGTGFASLSYLNRYPLTRIKIDRSFVQKIREDATSEDTAIVRSIIAMARSLRMEVTAEGVETRAQSEFLQAEGCDELQGFLFSKPLPNIAFEQFLGNQDKPQRPFRLNA